MIIRLFVCVMFALMVIFLACKLVSGPIKMLLIIYEAAKNSGLN